KENTLKLVPAFIECVRDSGYTLLLADQATIDAVIRQLNSIAALIIGLPQRSVAFLEEGGMAVESEIGFFNHVTAFVVFLPIAGEAVPMQGQFAAYAKENPLNLVPTLIECRGDSSHTLVLIHELAADAEIGQLNQIAAHIVGLLLRSVAFLEE